MTIKQKETIRKQKEEIGRLKKRSKKIIRKYIRNTLGIKEQELFDYLNIWGNLHSEKNSDLAFINKKRTEWAEGYKRACMDLHDKFVELKYIKEEKNGKR